MIQNNKVYDVLKYIAQIVLPALGTLYFALAQIWGLPFGEEVVGTLAALDAFLGVLLGISSSKYKKSGSKYDGAIDIFEDEETKRFSLNLGSDPYRLEEKDEVLFRVNKRDD